MERFLEALRAERGLIRIAALLLIGSAVLGYAASGPILAALQNSPVWKQLEETVRSIQKEPGFLHVFGIIFSNNLRAAATMLGLGLFFGVFPIVALVTNGVLLGVVLGAAGRSGQNPLLVFVKQILPHGILELPAIIIAAAFGIRLGILFSRWLISWTSPALRVSNREDWQHLLRRIPAVVLGIVILLVLAAVIESGLIYYFSPQQALEGGM